MEISRHGRARPTVLSGCCPIFENALSGNNEQEFIRLTAASMPTAESSLFLATAFADGQSFAAVRERDRRPAGRGVSVLVEMLLGRGALGRIATWQLLVEPAADPDTFRIASATPVAAVDGLVQLELDTTVQYEARDVTFRAPGLQLRLSSGSVFLARVADGPTALVFRGRGHMTFEPNDDAEAVQIKAYGGRSSIDTDIDGLFMRLNPAEFERRINSAQLIPVSLDPGDIARAKKLAQSLAVSSVSSPELGRVLALRVVGQNSVIVSLPQALPRDSRIVLDVYYAGRLPAQEIEREAMSLDGVPQAQVGLQDIVIPPEPRFLYSNRTFWYPQGAITDFATAAMEITVPAQFQVVASGSLINSTVTPIAEGEREGDSRAERTVQYLADRPVRYVACIISRFVPVGETTAPTPGIASSVLVPTGTPLEANDAVAVDVVATPRLLRSNRTLPERVADIVSFYADTIGEAPYPNFTLATLDAELPSGHSPAFFAVWNQPTLPTTLSWRGDPVALNGHPFFFLAHEVAHQWFGQAIGWKNYHEQWLSEGLSQYFAAMYAAHDRGPDTERQLFSQMRDSAMDLSRHGPIHLGYRLGHVQGDGRIFRGLVYNKSAVVLHMLRRLIGDEAFARGIQRFYRTHRFQKAGTDDIRAAFEAEAGVSLSRFFDRWILGFTLPQARLQWRMDSDDTHVIIRVEQIGDTFDFPLSVTIDYEGGESEQITLHITSAAHEVRMPVSTPVRRVEARDALTLVNLRR